MLGIVHFALFAASHIKKIFLVFVLEHSQVTWKDFGSFENNFKALLVQAIGAFSVGLIFSPLLRQYPLSMLHSAICITSVCTLKNMNHSQPFMSSGDCLTISFCMVIFLASDNFSIGRYGSIFCWGHRGDTVGTLNHPKLLFLSAQFKDTTRFYLHSYF